MIIAVKDTDKVIVCYTNTDVEEMLAIEDYVDEENIPIKFNDYGFLVGCARMSNSSNVVLYNDELYNQDFTRSNINRKLIPNLIEKLKNNKVKIDEDNYWGNSIVICNNDKIYDINTVFEFYELDNFISHANGDYNDIIKGILVPTEGEDVESRILKAINFLCEKTKKDLYPLVITDTLSKKFKRIYSKGEK